MRRVAFELPAGRTIELESPPRFLIPKILEEGGLAAYEPDTVATALAVCERRTEAFVDVGANVGVFSLAIAGVLGRQCLAFEPAADVADVLARAARRHDLPIVVCRIALSDRPGMVEFYVSARSDASSGLNPSFRVAREVVSVLAHRLDEILPIPIALVKIDTETTEAAVLRGAAASIERWRPHVIVEVLDDAAGAEIADFFARRAYVHHRIGPDAAASEGAPVVGCLDHARANWLFAPTPVDAGFFAAVARWRAAIGAAAASRRSD